MLVRNLWTNIIQKEAQSGKIAPVENKILELGQNFYPSDLVFPLVFLVDTLEHCNYNIGAQDNLWVLRVFNDIGVTFPQLFDIYSSLDVIHSISKKKKQSNFNLNFFFQKRIQIGLTPNNKFIWGMLFSL